MLGPCPQFIKRVKNKKVNNTIKQPEEAKNNTLKWFAILVERSV